MKALNEYISKARHDYMLSEMDEDSISQSAIEQFGIWLKEAIDAKVNEPNAMMLATVSLEGKPSARVLLLRDVSSKGFTFFTSYHSRKAADIDANPDAAMTFFWPELQRQVRIEGTLYRVNEEDSEIYFNSRPRENQLSAWAGQQSTPVTKRELLERLADMEKKFEGKQVPRPVYWGGYCLQPLQVEFWQGRPGRFHDRILYTLNESGLWDVCRLVP